MRFTRYAYVAITAAAAAAAAAGPPPSPPPPLSHLLNCHYPVRPMLPRCNPPHNPLSKCQIFAFNEPLDMWNQPRCCNIRVPPLRRFNEGNVEDMDDMDEMRTVVQVMSTAARHRSEALSI